MCFLVSAFRKNRLPLSSAGAGLPGGGDPLFGSPTGRTWEWRQGKRRCVCVCVCGSRTRRGLEKGGQGKRRRVCVPGPGEVLRGAREGERLLPSKEDA